jgi:DNA polymerase III epsilon subunit family exonuclease
VLRPDSDLEVEHLAGRVLPEGLLAEVRRTPGDTFLARLRGLAEQQAGPDAVHCWRFLYQAENLKGLGRLAGGLPELVDAVLAQGMGRYESPLERCHEQLEDPEDLLWARSLGGQLLEAAARGGRLFLTPAYGLEIPVKVMVRRALPALPVVYLTSDETPGAADLVIALGAGEVPAGPAAVVRLEDGRRLKTTQVFKALQSAEGRRYRKPFGRYVAFDTETTGKDIDTCEVVELAAVKVCDGRVVETFHSLIKCNRPIAPGASAVHGYTDADLAGQPALAEVWPRFLAFVGNDVLVAHNGHRFDIPVLRRLTGRWGGFERLTFFDTLTLARNLYPVGGLRLEDLAAKFGAAKGRSHHALDDSRCLAQVFEGLQQERLRRSRKTCLADLLDCVALGAAIEGREGATAEEHALARAVTWDEVSQHSALVDTYVEEAETQGVRCPPLEELIGRLGGGRWKKARGETAPRDRYPEAYARLSRLLATVQAPTREEALRAFLDKVALSRSDGVGVDRDRVSLLTFHATKGLEFSRVYIIGVEDNQLPGYHALAENREAEIREARRLLYVAMTRAKDRLTLTHCEERNGRPCGGTLFLDEMGLTQPVGNSPPVR